MNKFLKIFSLKLFLDECSIEFKDKKQHNSSSIKNAQFDPPNKHNHLNDTLNNLTHL